MRPLLNKNFFQVAVGFIGIIALSLLTFSVTSTYIESFYPDDEVYGNAAVSTELTE